jgi:Chaperonin GroEL (HSP60 family)
MDEFKFVARGYSSGIWVHVSRTAFVKVTHLKVLLNAADPVLEVLFFPGQIEEKNAEEHQQLLEKCAATALSSKLISQQKGFFAKMVVDAVLLLDELLPLNMIGVKKVPGGALEVSTLIF